jgi:hypothetical protein
VSESGLQHRGELERLLAAGYGAFLIGERFMTDPDPAAALQELTRALRREGGARGSGEGAAAARCS